MAEEKWLELKKEYENNRFRYQDTNSIPNFKEIIDMKNNKHYNVREISEVLQVLNLMHRESMLYYLFVEWLKENKHMSKVVARRFEDELEYENRYISKIDKIVHSKKMAQEVYELLKNDLKDSGEF